MQRQQTIFLKKLNDFLYGVLLVLMVPVVVILKAVTWIIATFFSFLTELI